MTKTWTPERVERLRELLAAKWTFEAIGKELGLTRGMVGGKAQRLRGPGLAFRKGSTWTPELIARLKAGHAEGRSFRAMGKELGVSHGSIIGKAHRLGLTQRGHTARIAGLAKPKPSKVRLPPRAPDPPPPPASLKGKPTIIELRSHQCRYAVGERDGLHVFCAEPALGSWCPGHRSIIFQRAV
jgi:hypothetical protein